MLYAFRSRWEREAGVRALPHRVIDKSHSGYLYPLFRQPLSIHPLVEKLGEESLEHLLTQSFYKYTNDISIIETRILNRSIRYLKIF